LADEVEKHNYFCFEVLCRHSFPFILFKGGIASSATEKKDLRRAAQKKKAGRARERFAAATRQINALCVCVCVSNIRSNIPS
jgi:hypothetical protein